MKKKIRIGDLLVQHSVITESQLSQALVEQKKTSFKLGRILTDLGFINEDKLLDVLSKQLNIPIIDLKYYDLKLEVSKKLPESHARRFRAIVLEEKEGQFLVGMSDPTDLFASDELARVLRKPVEQAIVREADLLKTLDLIYRRTGEINQFAGKLEKELGESSIDITQLEVEQESDAPVVKLLQSLFEDALQVNASDIHIEPDETVLRIRQRVDGVLQEHILPEKKIASALVLRLKLIAGLNISEKRIPQDGRINIRVKGRTIDVRLSTMPIQHGESVVMRLLDQSSGLLFLEQLGMPGELLKQLRSLIHRPHGMILVTGPTGSGKTTTLYGALNELNQPGKKIITVEDPVEYRLPRINQIQVNDKIDLTFSRVLRSALRQDPDIVMVGEIRDQETAQISLRAAMTGHLVLSTLHTNDAITSPLRLLDMGAENYLTAASLRAVIGQRLVRRICESCGEEYKPTSQEFIWIEAVAGKEATQKPYKKGKGCPRCTYSGYKGRIGVYELLVMEGEMVSTLQKGDHEGFAAAAWKSKHFRPLVKAALDLAGQAVTTIEEAAKLAEGLEE
ncbi:MAG: Flp pilus assembly complex ATPase component TadA [Gammaproteobacteria bacterium]|nr:Flp pilus assembly complex ATPase component TadA [Gammaproteobacteria bacterium]